MNSESANKKSEKYLFLLSKYSRVVLALHFLFLVSLATISYSNWFTTNPDTIDPWIYWGVGDNPSLSFLNEFGKTYYLQRYVVLVPQVAFNFIFGPYYSQLAVSVFWLMIAAFAIKKIVRRSSVYTVVITIFFLDRSTLGMYGVSYTQGSSISMMLLTAGYAASFLRSVEKDKTIQKRDLIGAGIAASALTNISLFVATLFLIPFLIAILIYLLPIKRLDLFPRLIAHLFLGFVTTQLILGSIYYLITGDKVPFIFRQIQLGIQLSTSSNPWGGSSGIDALFSKLQVSITAHWLFGPLLLITLLMFRSTFLTKLKSLDVQVFMLYASLGISTLFVLSLATHTNAIGYSWTALVTQFPFYIGIWVVIEVVFYRKDFQFVFLFLFLSQIVYVGLLLLHKNILDIFNLKSITPHCFIMFYVSGLLLYFTSELFFRSELSKTFVSLFVIAHVTIVTFVVRVDFVNYAGELYGGGIHAKSNYYELSLQRDYLAKIRTHQGKAYRLWLTPDNSPQLKGSQLYAYSLISLNPGKAECSQVEWAVSSPSLLVTFRPEVSISEIEELYLKPCGYSLSGISTKWHQRETFNGATVGIITPSKP